MNRLVLDITKTADGHHLSVDRDRKASLHESHESLIRHVAREVANFLSHVLGRHGDHVVAGLPADVGALTGQQTGLAQPVFASPTSPVSPINPALPPTENPEAESQTAATNPLPPVAPPLSPLIADGPVGEVGDPAKGVDAINPPLDPVKVAPVVDAAKIELPSNTTPPPETKESQDRQQESMDDGKSEPESKDEVAADPSPENPVDPKQEPELEPDQEAGGEPSEHQE